MAERIARQFMRKVPAHLAEDVRGDAILGLVEAAAYYDPHRPEPFEGFAPQRIRGAIQDGLRRGDIVPRRKRTEINKSRATDNPLPSPKMVGAEALNTVAREDRNPEEEADRNQRILMVRKAVAKLPARLQQLLDLYLVEGKTLDEVGKILRVSESRISQLYKRAVTLLRAEMERKIK